MSNPDIKLFRDEEFEEVKLTPEKVVCLGMEFESDDARRTYFREELRKKLPELRQIEGFPIGEDEDIIKLSDPPYYTACPNPWLNDFVAEWEQEKVELERQGKRSAEFEVNEPYASDVSEGKYNPLYLLHPYLTKVPYTAIIKYLEHYTQPGDIVLDGFAGTGMTGAACRLISTGKRNPICVDLSTLASFIGSFVNSNISNVSFAKEIRRIIKEVKSELGWMFETKVNGGFADIDYVIWSNVYICPNCGNEIVFYKEAYNEDSGVVSDSFVCSNCASDLTKSQCEIGLETLFDNITNTTFTMPKRVPCLIGYTYKGKRGQKKPTNDDIEQLNKINNTVIKDWVPLDKIIDGDEIGRAKRDGIQYFYQYYTKRVLAYLCKIRSLASNSLFYSLITKVAFQSTLMYRFCKKGGGPMSGTMYIPALIKEVNILNQLEAFINDRLKIELNDYKSISSTQSSTNLFSIKDNSVDYIFTDPPFGHNLMYSELNYISEMWLKVKTNNSLECIENKCQKKDLYFYQNLMQSIFREFYRVLKPGKWISVEFSNTSASVWNAIQYALSTNGFIVSNVSALDKKKESYKAVTTTTAVKQDLVITCYKPTDELINRFEQSTDKSVNAMDFIEELLYHLPVHLEKNNSTTAVIERSPKILYDRLISYYVQHGYAIPMDAQEFQKALRERFIERDGMFFTASQTVEYEAKKEKTDGVVPMALFISSEAEGIEWLKRELAEPQTYQEILPNWMKDMVAPKKGDVLPELATILEENFIKDEDGKWRKPDAEKAADLEILRGKKLMKEFNLYLEQASKPKAKRMKDTRLEVLRYGFKECYKQKNYQTIVTVGDHIQESLLQEDEVLLQYYDIASMRV